MKMKLKRRSLLALAEVLGELDGLNDLACLGDDFGLDVGLELREGVPLRPYWLALQELELLGRLYVVG